MLIALVHATTAKAPANDQWSTCCKSLFRNGNIYTVSGWFQVHFIWG